VHVRIVLLAEGIGYLVCGEVLAYMLRACGFVGMGWLF
jgi:hypothetical protein